MSNIEQVVTASPKDRYPWTLRQRTIMLSTAFFVSAMMSGITVGHLAFREFLLASQPNLLCSHHFLLRRDSRCYEREIALNSQFYLSAVITKLVTFPVGWALDKWGPRFTTMFGCVVFALGFGMLATSPFNLHSIDWQLSIGYWIVAIGGTLVFIPSLQLCRIIPKLSSLMMAALTSAFDVSAIVFFVMGRLYEYYQGRIGVKILLGGYIIVATLGFVLVTSFYPDGDLANSTEAMITSKPKQQRSYTNLANNVGDTNDGGTYQTSSSSYFSSSVTASSPTSTNSSFSVKRTLCNLDFWMMTIFTGIMTTRFALFIANLHLRMAQSSLEWRYQRAVITGFLTFFPLGGFISLPAIGQLLQSLSLAANTLLAWLAIVLVWGRLEFIMTTDMVGASVILCSILRPYYYSVTNQLSERLFGRRHCGKVYGLVLGGAGLINLLALPAVYDGRWRYTGWIANLPWLIRFSANLGFIFPIYLYYKGM